MDHRNRMTSSPAVLTISVVLVALFALQAANSEVADRMSLAGQVQALSERPWTPLTVMFLHENVAHLALMILMLVAFGTRLERVARSWDVVTVYLSAGLAGSLAVVVATAVWATDGTLVGASAAVFGVASAVLPRQPSVRLYGGTAIQWLAMLVGINIVFLAAQPLSAIAHLAGLAAGAGYGRWLLARSGHDSCPELRLG